MATLRPDNHSFKNFSSDSAAFTLDGGNYAFTYHATWGGGGNVQLQVRAEDGATFVPALAAWTVDGMSSALLPPGTYKLHPTTATGAYVGVKRLRTA